MSMNIFVICNETLLICFYLTLLVGILSIGDVSIETVGAAAIKIVMSALALCCLFAMSQACAEIYTSACKKRQSKVHPNIADVTQFDRNQTIVEVDDVFSRKGIELKEEKKKNRFEIK